MIYLFAGDDSKKKIANYEKFMETLDPKTPVFPVNKNDFDPVQLESFFSGAGLFFDQCVVVLSNILEKEEIREFILEKLKLMGDSGNIFVFLDGKLLKPILDKFREARAELNIFELPKEKKEKYDSFVLAYDLEKKDKLHLWIHAREALEQGVSLEELVGILFWKGKDLILKKNFSKFKEAELANFIARLSYLLPEARAQGRDDEATFEQFLLEAF